METVKEILEKYDKNVEFPFLDGTYVVAADRNVYHHLKQKYLELADDAKSRFRKCLNEIKNIDDLYENVDSAFTIAMNPALNEAAGDAISLGCYTLDASGIISVCLDRGYFEEFEAAVKAFAEKDAQIQSTLADAKEYRKLRKASQGAWDVKTYDSLGDAWVENIKLKAMNSFGSTGHSIANALGNMMDEAKADEERNNLFVNNALRNQLINSIWTCACNLRRFVMDLVKEITGISITGWVTEDDAKKAESMFQNMMKVRMSDSDKLRCARSMLELNPYKAEYYGGLIGLYFEHTKEFVNIAEYFQIKGVKEILDAAICEVAKSSFGTTIDDIDRCRVVMIQVGEKASLTAEELQPALKLIAKEAESRLAEYVKQHMGETEEEAQQCKAELDNLREKLGYEIRDVPASYKLINERINYLDTVYRTVNGVVIETREKADQAKADVQTYSDVLNHPCNFTFRTDFLNHIAQIQNLPIDPQIIAKQVNDVNVKLAEFDKLCSKAKRFQFIQDHGGLPFYNGDSKDMAIHYGILGIILFYLIYWSKREKDMLMIAVILLVAYCGYMFIFKVRKEREIWNKLTQNGAYRFQDIIGDQGTNMPPK